MSRQGMRVLALAMRTVAPAEEKLTDRELTHKSRSWAEDKLTFVGFAAFRCLVRKDSKEVLSQLKNSSHLITMITGDAVLTAIHVAKEVDIIIRPALVLTMKSGDDTVEKDSENDLFWASSEDDTIIEAYKSDRVPKLAASYDLCVIGKSLLKTMDFDENIWTMLHHLRVFARMTPELKERVMICLKKQGHHTLMCGDGANDVGALKQADIGVALLSGFGVANTGGKNTSASSSKTTRSKFVKSISEADKTKLMALSIGELKKHLTEAKLEFKECREKGDLINLLCSRPQNVEKSLQLVKRKQQLELKKKLGVPTPLTAQEKKELMAKKTR